MAGDSCRANSPHEVVCQVATSSSGGNVDLELGELDDRFDASAVNDLSVYARGGSGDDHLRGASTLPSGGAVTGGDGADTLLGGPGADGANGGPGSDVIDVGAGDDSVYVGGVHLGEDGVSSNLVVVGSIEPDHVEGGPGHDTVAHVHDAGGVRIDLNGGGGQGVPGENDTLLNFESAITGDGKDRMIGTDGPNHLQSYGGSDFIDARGGDDTVIDDRHSGGPQPTPGSDRIETGDGDDDVRVGVGSDVVLTGAGDDTIHSTDDFDSDDDSSTRDHDYDDKILCGAGSGDYAVADRADRVAADCEIVGSVSGIGAERLARRLSLASTLRRGVRQRVRCDVACGITGEAFAQSGSLGAARRVRIGRGSLSLKRDASGTLVIRLTSKAKRALKRARRVPVTVRLRMRPRGGRSVTKTYRTTLVR